MEKKFIHLHTHTEFSLSNGLLTIPQLLKKTTDCNMPAVAITDLCNLYGAIKFYQAALQTGIKPILGADVYICDQEKSKQFHQLTLLCQNNLGYQHLLQLISKSFLNGQKNGIPTIQRAWLKNHHEGLIALSKGINGNIGIAILANQRDKAIKAVKEWQTLFKDRFYIELTRIGKETEVKYISQALTLAEEYSLPTVATNFACFLEASDFEAHEARVCIQQGVTLSDPNRDKHFTEQQYFRHPNEMYALFQEMPEALENSYEIAKRCNVILELGKNRLPHFQVPEHFSTESYLREMANKGLQSRLSILPNANTESYQTRLNLELEVINKMGFAGYFLIVADFTRWAKENGIPVGPGRGSGPGSLVAYSLNITDLDPIALELLFERFLNPERISMPDFDIDFCMEGRDKVIEYVMEKHGAESVAQIITYGTMAAKAVVRDVGRVLGLSYGFVDKIAKLIPFELGMTLEKALKQEPLLKARYEEEDEVRNLIDLALKLEGLTRNVGKHAGGIVIAPGKLTDFVPLYCEDASAPHPVTQFDKDDVETVGLVKFDFLGLKTLTIIDRALKIINEKRDVPININLIPLNDEASFKLLKECRTTAIFQLESPGMRDLIKRLKPDCFEDLTALVALFRPGPLQSGMVDDFINRKHGRARVFYPHPKLEAVLKSTYGVILYQEQVMQIAQVLAGYTLGAADILRRAMGKKKPEEMAKQREIFCVGAIKGGVNLDLANQIFDLMEKFAGYGFNKSHSVSYALIAYQTAWLKANYKAAFMAATLSSDMDRTDKIIGLLNECKSLDIEVAPPDINQSNYFFTVINDTHLQYGLGAIKGLGEAPIESIIDTRKKGTFNHLFDFCDRVDLRKINRRALEALIKSGSFDSIDKNRASLMATIPNAVQHAEQISQNKFFGQPDLIGLDQSSESLFHAAVTAWDEIEQLQGEKETLGFYLSGHPLNRYRNELKHFVSSTIAEINPNDQSIIKIAGIITSIRTRQTKRGDRLAIFMIEDGTGFLDAICFPDIFQKNRSLMVEDKILIVEGEVSIDEFNQRPRMVVKDLFELNEARHRYAKFLEIHLEQEMIDSKILQFQLTKHLGGNCKVIIYYLKDNLKASITLGTKWNIKPNDQLIENLHQAVKAKSITYTYG